jgi:DNA-binding transcriptional regulator LsrR (DeoR family)
MIGRGDREALDRAEAGLAARAAWLSYIGGYRQEDIAERLHVSRIKVNRLIAQAHRRGIVRVFVEGAAADCVALEDALVHRYGLNFAVVVPSLNGGDLPLLTLGAAGARYLHRVLEEGGADRIIGFGHGRTLAAVVDHLPRVAKPGVRFVSLLGGLVRIEVASPFEIIQRLAERTGGEGYFLPVPFVADSAADKAVLTAQRSVRRVFDLARRADLYVIGIGAVGGNAFMRLSGMIPDAEFERLERAGAVGEVLGEFLRRDGRPLDVDVSKRAIGLKLEDLRGKQVVAIAGGAGKVAAIDAVLRTGVVRGLITDEFTANGIAGRSAAS